MLFHFGALTLDADRRELRQGSTVVAIRTLPLRLLLHLVHHRDRIVSKDELFGELWPETVVSDSALSSALRDLRRALVGSGGSADWISTARGRGLRFVGQVQEADGAELQGPDDRAREESPFVGRESSSDVLRQALQTAEGGRGNVVLLAGEAGIGKSRLASEFQRWAEARGAEVLEGRCLESDGAPPFRPWQQILRTIVRRRSPAALRDELGAWAAEIARIVPEVREHLPALVASPRLEHRLAQFRLIDAVTEVLLHSGKARTRVLMLDDLHRADLSSLELLDHLVREVGASRVLVIAAYRDTEVEAGSGRAESLGQISRFSQVVSLERLGLEEVAEYCARTIAVETSEPRARELFDLSGGNPFLLGMLVSLDPHQNRSRLPRGVREAVLAQIEGLRAEAQRLLRLGSVFGRDFRIAALADVAELEVPPALKLVEEAAEHRLVEHGEAAGEYRFSHAVVADVLYGTLETRDRLDAHVRAALALERLLGSMGDHVAELAHHFSQAAPAGSVQKALDACLGAAERAADQFAFAEAAAHYERALSVLGASGGEDRDRLRLELDAAEAWSRTWQHDRARAGFARALELARRLGDVEAIGRASIGTCLGEEEGIPEPERIATLEVASRVVIEEGPLRGRVLGRLGYALWFAEPRSRAREVLAEAIELGRRVGDPDALAAVLVRAYYVYWAPGLREERGRVARDLAWLAPALRDRSLRVEARTCQLWEALGRGDRDSFRLHLAAQEADASELRQPIVRWWASVFRSSATAALEGRFADAFEQFELGERLADEARSTFHAGAVLIQRVNALMDWGRPAEALPLLERILQVIPNPLTLVHLQLMRALCGDRDVPRAHLDALARDDFSVLTPDVNFYNGAFMMARLCQEVDARAEAAVLYERLSPHAVEHLVAAPGWLYRGSVERHLGLLAGLAGDPERAAGHFARGLASERRMQARPSVAQGLLDFGAMLRRSGDGSGAREALEESLEIATELDMALVRDRARELLRR